MKTVVYADILIIINFLMNYILLRATAVLTGCSFKSGRLVVSAFIGSIFSLSIYIENITPLINSLIKILYMTVLLLTAFRIKSVKMFIRHFFTFFAVNLIFGGIMLALNVYLFPETSLYNNGIVYFDLNILSLTFISVFCYILIYLISSFIKSKTPHGCIYKITINYKNKSVTGNALYDSGNKLCDCFSGKPVIIADRKSFENIIDGEKIEEMKNYRLIPFSTISGNGTIPAFMADSVEITISDKKQIAENIYIGITENKILSGGYSALFGTPFIEQLTNNTINSRGKNHEKNNQTIQ